MNLDDHYIERCIGCGTYLLGMTVNEWRNTHIPDDSFSCNETDAINYIDALRTQDDPDTIQ